MPGVIMFGRRWGVATDDFVYPAASDILLRIIWVTALSTVLGIHHDSFTCDNGPLLATYYATMIGVLSVTIVIDVLIVRISSRGRIVDDRPRRLVVPLLYSKFTIYFFEIVWTALGTYWAFSPGSSQCPWDVLVLARCATIVGWILLFVLLIAVVVVFDPVGGYYHRRHRRQHIHGDGIRGDRGTLSDTDAEGRYRERDDLKRLWKLRCRLLCCGCCQCFDSEDDTSSAFEDISQLLTSYFAGVDFVASDIAAGLILVQQYQNTESSTVSHVQFQSIYNAVHQSLDESERAGNTASGLVTYASDVATELKGTAIELPTDTVDSTVAAIAAAPDAAAVATAAAGLNIATVPDQAAEATAVPVLAAVEAAVRTAAINGTAASSSDTATTTIAGETLNQLHAMIGRFVLSSHWMTLSNAAHYMKYALASYGWAFYVYDNRLTGPAKLCLNSKWCFCLRGGNSDVKGDNCIACNTAALLLQTNISREDILYVRFVNKVYETPFYVAYDHEKRSIVVSIRGTLSLSDALTDLSAEVDNMEVPGVEDARAHRGILKAALQTKNTLQRKQLLETALSHHPDYDIVVTGHSLGAGTAAVLAILLKDEYPNLKCFSYSPPGWLVSLSLSRYARDFVCSVVLGNDLVPRMGLVTFDKLKNQMLRLVEESNTPKYSILASGFWQALCSSRSTNIHPRLQNDTVEVHSSDQRVQQQPQGSATGPSGPGFSGAAGHEQRGAGPTGRGLSGAAPHEPRGAGPDERQPLLVSSAGSSHQRQQELVGVERGVRYTEEVRSGSTERQSNGQVNEASEDIERIAEVVRERVGDAEQTYSMPEFITCPLYMPGQVLYLHPLNTYSGQTDPVLYRAGWSLPETFDEIVVDSTMLTDHMPHNVYNALRAAVADTSNTDCPSCTVVLQRPRNQRPTQSRQQQHCEII